MLCGLFNFLAICGQSKFDISLFDSRLHIATDSCFPFLASKNAKFWFTGFDRENLRLPYGVKHLEGKCYKREHLRLKF